MAPRATMTAARSRGRVTAGVVVAGLVLAGCGGGGTPRKQQAATAPSTSRGAAAGQPPASASRPTTVSATLAPWHLPAPVSRAAAVVDGSGIVIAGGLATGDVSTAAVVRVDPQAGSAQRVGALPLAVHDTAGALLGGNVFVFGGGGATTVGTIQRITGTATATAGALPRPRSDLAVASTATKAYVVGGFDGHTMDRDVLVTTDGSTFSRIGTLVTGVRYPAVALAAGALWVIGGQLSTAESTKTGGQSDAIQRVDLATGTVTVTGHLPNTLGHASAFSLGDQLFVAGGQVVTTPSAKIFHIDTSSGAVNAVGDLPGPRSDAAVAVRDGVAWLLGGETTDPAHPLASVVEVRVTP